MLDWWVLQTSSGVDWRFTFALVLLMIGVVLVGGLAIGYSENKKQSEREEREREMLDLARRAEQRAKDAEDAPD